MRTFVLLAVLPVLCVAALASAAYAFITYEKFSALLGEAENARFGLVAKGVKAGIEANLNLGLQLAGLTVAKEILERERILVSDTKAVAVYGTDGTILFSSGNTEGLTDIPGEWLRANQWTGASTQWRALGVSLTNPYGVSVGGVAVLFPLEPRDATLSAMTRKLALSALWTWLGAAGIMLVGSIALRRRPLLPFYLLAAITICIALIGMAQSARVSIDAHLLPVLERKTEAVAFSLKDRLLNALDLGIAFENIEGAEEYFEDVLHNNREMAFIALSGPDGMLFHVAGAPDNQISEALGKSRPRNNLAQSDASWRDPLGEDAAGNHQILSVPLMQNQHQIGILHLGVQRGHLESQLAGTQLSLFVLLVVAVVIAIETMRFVLTPRIQMSAAPTGTPDVRSASVSRSAAIQPILPIRLITFLFMFGEQLSRPFLPVFAGKLLPTDSSDSIAAILAGVPVSVFMLTVALSIPYLTGWTRRVGLRRSFLGGAFVAAIGLIGAAFCISIWDLVLWRAVTALGYALMYLACQNFILENTVDSVRPQGLAIFIGAIMVAELCAPGIGGMLADHMGERAVFSLGAVVMLLAAALGAAVFRNTACPAGKSAGILGIGMALMRNLRFAILILTAAIPAKFALTAFMFYIVPVSLSSFEANYGEIGRVAMLYALPSLLAVAFISRVAKRLQVDGLLVALGGIIAGAGFIPMLFWPGPVTVAIGVLALGAGHALSISSQLSLVALVCEREIVLHGASGVFGFFRFVERLGAALGPLAAGILTAFFGPIETAGILGVFTFACAVTFAVLFLVLGARPEIDFFPASPGNRGGTT